MSWNQSQYVYRSVICMRHVRCAMDQIPAAEGDAPKLLPDGWQGSVAGSYAVHQPSPVRWMSTPRHRPLPTGSAHATYRVVGYTAPLRRYFADRSLSDGQICGVSMRHKPGLNSRLLSSHGQLGE